MPKLTYNKNEPIKTECKRFAAPFTLSDNCPVCGNKQTFDTHLDYPYLNSNYDVSMYCYHQDTDYENERIGQWTIKIRLDLNITLVGDNK